MSVEKIASVLHHADVKESKKLLLIGIANHEGDGGAWPAIETLARYANIHPRNVKKQLEELEELGLVEIVNRPGKTSFYYTRVECPDDCDRSSNHKTTERASATPRAIATPTERATALPTERATALRTVIKPSYEPNNNPFTVEQLFNTFMERYPRRSDERNAWSSFGKLSLPDALKALDGLDRYMNSNEFPADRKYIPYAANWIDRRYWETEYTPKRKPENTVAERIAQVKQQNTQNQHATQVAETAAVVVECKHGNPGFCRDCYHEQTKDTQWQK